jgi:pentatricopeptide repeat protein
MKEGEKIIEEMKKAGSHINIETCTALLKGYSLAGMIHKADDLFESMCSAKGECFLFLLIVFLDSACTLMKRQRDGTFRIPGA